MVRCGYTAAGTQRWKCGKCKKVACRKRKDTSERNIRRLMERWLTDTESLSKIAKRSGVDRSTLSKRFSKIGIRIKSVSLPVLPHNPVLVLDGIMISRDTVALIVHDGISRQPLAWDFAERECFASWFSLLEKISRRYNPLAAVSDGQKGLRKAVLAVFQDITHQRCIAHIVRLSLAKLTKNPQTEAGRELRKLVCVLGKTKTKEEAGSWKAGFEDWDGRHETFLKERSINPLTGRKWYTHRKLRTVRSLIKTALPNMFFFTEDNRIPNTTNCVEGGINARIAELLHRHRGITEKQKMALVHNFLYSKRKRKPSTRNAT